MEDRKIKKFLSGDWYQWGRNIRKGYSRLNMVEICTHEENEKNETC
jgi:hypothetical protein